MPVPNTDRSRKLSDNFYLYEFDCRDGTPVPEHLVDSLAAFVLKNLQTLREFFGAPITVTSGYRHEAYNKAIKGSQNSYHIYDAPGREGKFAVDFVVHGRDPQTVYTAIEGLIRLGLLDDGGLHAYDNFIHYDSGPRRRWR